MHIKNNFKWLLVSTIYTVSVNILTVVVMLLYAHNVIRDITSLVFLLVIYTISAVVFSYVRGEDAPPFRYNLSVLLNHVVLSVVIILVLGWLYTGWETAMFYWAEIFSIVFFVVMLLFDTILCLLKRCSRRS